MVMVFNEINNEDDLLRLIINPKKSESHYLEFKSILKDKPSDLTKEVTAFANASGGVIIYGIIEDENHLAKESKWLELGDTQHKIEDQILSWVQPKFTNYQIKTIQNSNDFNKGIFLIDIKKGSQTPYMNSEKIHYIRREKKSEPMNAQEIREALFRSGLFDALLLELKDNKQLVDDFIKNYGKLTDVYKEVKTTTDYYKAIQLALYPFKTEAWRALTYSGLLSTIQEISELLINLYQAIYKVNNIIDVSKFGYRRIITQQEQPSYYILTVINQIIVIEIKNKIESILKYFLEK